MVRYTHTVLKASLRQAVQWRQLPFNPADNLSLPPRVHRERVVLTAEQVNILLTSTKNDRRYAMWAVLLTTGVRPQEAAALRWSDLDRSKLLISRALVEVRPGHYEIGPVKTNKGRRSFTVPQVALDALAIHRARQSAEILKAGTTYERNDLIFATPDGKHVCLHNVYRSWQATLRKLGLPKAPLSNCRHTHASLLQASGVPVKAVSERLGHASAKMTLDVYCHVIPETEPQTAVIFDNLLLRATG